jgi:hypothetical protein
MFSLPLSLPLVRSLRAKTDGIFPEPTNKVRSLRVLKGYPPETFTVFSQNRFGKVPYGNQETVLGFRAP